MIRFLDRLIVVAFALVMAAATAFVVCLVGLFSQPIEIASLAQLLGLTAFASALDGKTEELLALAGQAAMTGLALWLGPIILVAAIGESWGRRSWIFYAGGMALAFVAAPLATGIGLIGLALLYHAAAGLAAIGIAAGSVYWLIAGRGARRTVGNAAPQRP